MKRISKKSPGQITVFLSLVFILIFSLIFTALEAARSRGLRMRLQIAVNAGISSVFAMYDKPLWDKYGLLLFADRYGNGMELEEVFCDYAGRNGAPTDLPGGDWLALENIQPTSLTYTLATDSRGEAFVDMVATYMEQAGLAKAVLSAVGDEEEVSGDVMQTDIFDENGELDTGALLNRSSELSDDMDEAEAEQQAEAEKEAEETGEPVREVKRQTAATEEEQEQADELYGSLLDTLHDFVNKGLLALVWDGEDISDEQIDTEGLPSYIDDYYKDRTGVCEYDNSAVDEVLFREYIMTTFENCQSSEGKSAELEYIISGGKSDSDNVAHVVKVLIALRCGLNFIFLNKSSRFRNEAKAVATIVAGWTGNELIVKGVQELMLLIWALAEGICDVRSLLQGEGVPFYKTEESWKLSLEGAASGESADSGSAGGIKYEGYLRLMLYMTDTEDAAYRTMDLMQMNIQEEEPDFYMKNCIYAARIEATGEAEDLFPYIPDGLDYYLSAESAYAYGPLTAG